MGESVRLSFVIIIIVVESLVISPVLSLPHPYAYATPTIQETELNGLANNKVVRQAGEGEGGEGPLDPNIQIIEDLAKKLNPNWLADDVQLAQKLDKLNDISKYLDPDDNTTIIFERSKLDSNKDIVVLAASEDHRMYNGSHKRTYVVLKKVPPITYPGSDPKPRAFYNVFYAYLRDARETDNQTDVVAVNGSQVTVEWDVWDDRAPSVKFHAGWGTCHYTILFSCSINETAIDAALDNKTLSAITEPAPLPSNTTAPPPPPPAETSAVAESQGNENKSQVDTIVIEAGYDPEEYTDLYGDFDVIPTGSLTGRSLFGGLTNYFTSSTTKTTKKKKLMKVVKNSTTSSTSTTSTSSSSSSSSSSFGAGLFNYLPSFLGGTGTTPSPSATPVSNANAIYGTYYKGIEGTPPIFIPDGTQTPVLFISDAGTTASFTIHGTYVPGTIGNPDVFTADDPQQTANVYMSTGTMIPDAMTMSDITGGIRGTLSGESFRPVDLGSAMWFNPDSPEAKGVWTTYKKPQNDTARPKTTKDGTLIVYGVEFPGVSGSPDIFIPDGSGIPGFFVPNDPAHPEATAIPHGSFVATKPAGHGTFYADTKELDKIKQVRGAFMPDNMNLTGAIAGLITKDVANTWVFVVDVPGMDYEYYKGKNNTGSMWTPFLLPGEWKPPTTPAPYVAPAAAGGASPPTGPTGPGTVTTTPKPGTAAPASQPKKGHTGFMFGTNYPGMGSLDIFIPDGVPVPGVMIPEDINLQQLTGDMSGDGKKSPDKGTFTPSTIDANATATPIHAVFVPNGIAPGNGIIGELTLNADKKSYSYVADPPSKGHFFLKAKDLSMWTPYTPPVAPVIKKQTLVEKVLAEPFLAGFYVPGVPGTDPIFVPDDGAVGCFYPDVTTDPKSCGTYYPEKPDAPTEFVENTVGTLKNNTPGIFIPDLNNGSASLNRFHATFIIKPPTQLVPDSAPFKGWSQAKLKISTTTKRTVSSTTSSTNTTITEHNPYTPIPVAGGFNGYPTNGKGIEGLVDPNNPIFKEFLQYKSRMDKSMNENNQVVIVNNMQEINNYLSKSSASSSTTASTQGTSGDVNGTMPKGPPGVQFINLDEYRSYVNEKYSIKTTKIKTETMNEQIELAVPKSAEKYIKVKKKPFKINVHLKTQASAGASGGNGTGAGAGSGSGSGKVTVKGFSHGKECDAPWSTSASATAKAVNGSSSTAEANAINGGVANAMSLSKDGATAASLANVKEGGHSNALSQAKGAGSNSSATTNALRGASANAASQNANGTSGSAESNAQRLEGNKNSTCGGDDGEMPDEIEVDSHAVAQALGNGTGSSTATTNTNVKINMAGLAAKIAELQAKHGQSDDDGENEINIDVDASSSASAGGRSFGGFGDQDEIKKKGGEGKLGRTMTGKAFLINGKKLRTGWKTEYKIIAPNVTFAHEGIVFYGLGSCPYTSDVPIEDLHTLDSEALIDFYIKILRMECTENVKLRIMKLFNLEYLEFSTESDYLQVPADNRFLKQPKISDDELRMLSTAFELFMFTKTYKELLAEAGKKEVAPYMAEGIGTFATRSVRFLSEFALNYVEHSRKYSPNHYVRLTRNLLTTLRTAMIKLYQDGALLKPCIECSYDIEMNHHDQIHMMGVLQFIIHGLSPYERGQGKKDIRSALKEFLVLNRNKLESRVKEYDNQFPK